MSALMKKVRRKLELYETAVREHAFIGAQHPDDHEDIQRQYVRRKTALIKSMYELIGEDPPWNQGKKECSSSPKHVGVMTPSTKPADR